LEAIEKRYEELNRLMSQPEAVADYEQWQVLAQEQSAIQGTVSKYREYRKAVKELEETQLLLDDGLDPEMTALVKQEMEALKARCDNLRQDLESFKIPAIKGMSLWRFGLLLVGRKLLCLLLTSFAYTLAMLRIKVGKWRLLIATKVIKVGLRKSFSR
jgi:hypothetical protein